ncbi:MAG: hypothetical protein E6P95_00755 [Candidatus Moraniibacteriota bacterium]|nr:MAG: hypothetical protein E6P95_00755 [Candidatus Moranbacteria bacterium]
MQREILIPGDYKVLINDEEAIDFSWGVLVVNTDQDVYKPKENVFIQMASLSSTGHTLCNSNLKLRVNNKELPIEKSQTCGADNVTDNPDYFTYYQANEIGDYNVELTNLDTNKTVYGKFSVQEETDFIVERIGATRINPFKSEYQMTIKITANKQFDGEVTETLPQNFTATSPTKWYTKLASGESTTYTYKYQAPKVSPDIFYLGPVQIGDHQETKVWSLASDATFQMQTGYYVGTGVDDLQITGVGFQPDLVLIKDDTANGADGVNWKSSVMPSETSQVLSDGDVDVANNAIQSLDSDGFTLGTDADVNTANVRFVWIAFGGSDCTSSGTFCVGSYSGNNGATQAITSVGFQPNYVAIKSSSALVASFMTSSMATNVSQRFDGNNETTDGTRIVSLDSTGFTVGSIAAVNDTPNTYWFFAFKTTSGAFAEGTYTGNGTTQSPSVGFRPNYVMVKIANATAATSAVFNQTESNSDYSGTTDDSANGTNWITSLDSNGFTVGSDARVNENTKTLYWVAFGGASNPTGTGTYKMATGSYSGNGTSQSISSLGFRPDLVIVKHNDQTTDQYAVFRTSLTAGDATHVFANSTNVITGAITSIDSDGFSVGSNATTNTSGDTYYWTAFGNAWNPTTGSGSADFTVGAYTGSAGDDRNILRLPFQPNLITVKRHAGSAAGFKTSEMSGDLTSLFNATAETTDWIQAINSDGFQIGGNAGLNTVNGLVHFFAFKNGNTFAVGTYTGNGSSQNITSPGFAPDLTWVKKASGGTARGGILRTSTQAGNAAQPFLNSPTATTHITGLLSNGFSVGAGNLANENTFSYRYATWMINVAPTTPTLDSPSNSATNQSLTPALLTTTTDTSSDYLRYKIELCTNVGMTTGCQTFDQTSSQTGWSGQNTQTSTAYTSGTQATYTIQSALTANTTYYWRSYAIDPAGTNTWSTTQGTPYSFTTTTAPSAPSAPYTEGATNPTGVIDLTPEFSAIHSDSDSDPAVYYEIEVNTASNFASTVMWDSGQTSMSSLASGVRSTDVSYAGTALSYNGTTYYWRIRFWDNKGAVSSWSSTQNFSTNSIPATLTLDSPADTATNQSLTPSLLTTSSDADSDYLRYKIELCENVGMTTNCQTFDQTSSQTGWSGQNTETSTAYTSGTQANYTIQSPLTANFTYYWRSYAIDPAGTNTWSSTQGSPYSFTTLGGGGGGNDSFYINGVNLNGVIFN